MRIVLTLKTRYIYRKIRNYNTKFNKKRIEAKKLVNNT